MIYQSVAEAGIEECGRNSWKCVGAFKRDLPSISLCCFTYKVCLKVFCAGVIMLTDLTSVVFSLLGSLAGRTCMVQLKIGK